MRTTLLFVLFGSVFFSACKKKDIKPPNRWNVGNKTYKVDNTQRNGNNLFVYDADGNYISASFLNLPVSDNNYIITSVADNSNEVIIAVRADGEGYVSAVSAEQATVKVEDNKITITVPKIWVYNTAHTDSVEVYGTFYEP